MLLGYCFYLLFGQLDSKTHCPNLREKNNANRVKNDARVQMYGWTDGQVECCVTFSFQLKSVKNDNLTIKLLI